MAKVARKTRSRRHNPEGRMSVMDHLRELRRRVILILVFVAVGATVGWILYDPVLHFLSRPYCSVPAKFRYHPADKSGCDLVYTGVLDGFTTRLKVSVITGAVFSAPLWLYQIWAFVTPGLRRAERKYTLIFIALSTILFAAGMSLAYVVLAKGLRIIIEQGGENTAALITVNQYLSFVTLMLVAFGAAFEVPLLVVMANLAGALPAKWLVKSQRIAIFLIFLFAAVATPTTDPVTMCAMAIPMVLLFEAAVVFAVYHDRRKARRKALEKAEREAAEGVLDDATPSTIEAIPEPLEHTLRRNESWSDIT